MDDVLNGTDQEIFDETRLAEWHKQSSIKHIEDGGDWFVISKEELAAINIMNNELGQCRHTEHKPSFDEAERDRKARRIVNALLLRMENK
jgi:hypothetical protein